MRVFVAGASGVVGRRLVPLLVDRGHEVVGSARRDARRSIVEDAGARALTLDLTDRAAVERAIVGSRTDVIVHAATALPENVDLRRFDRSFELTNHLRTEGTRNLLDAAERAGVGRLIAHSFTGWPNERHGPPVKQESDPLDPHPPSSARRTLDAIRTLEDLVTGRTGVAGVVLRLGFLYGPGTAIGEGGVMLGLVQKRMLPLVGGGAGVWSFLHVDDAAAITAHAIEHDATGVFNAVDDEPAAVSEWLPVLAETIGARPPWRVPTWLARPLIGAQGVSLMTSVRGSSNAKAKDELGWRPSVPSWRVGFRERLGAAPTAGG